MKKRTLITLGVIVLAVLAALSWLRSYQLELIHIVVTNAVVQKAPADYPEERIRLGFEQALNQVGHTGRETYLRTVAFAVSTIRETPRVEHRRNRHPAGSSSRPGQ